MVCATCIIKNESDEWPPKIKEKDNIKKKYNCGEYHPTIEIKNISFSNKNCLICKKYIKEKEKRK